MGLYEHFPYTNLQNLNLDWILEVVKDFKLKFESAEQWLADAIAAMSAAKDENIAAMAEELQTLLDQMQAQYDELIGGFEAAYQNWINIFADSVGTIQAEAQANIEATGRNTIASIPADYTTFYANALKQQTISGSTITDFNAPMFVLSGYIDNFDDVTAFANRPTGATGAGSVFRLNRPATSPAVQASANLLILDNGHIYIRNCSVDSNANYTYGAWLAII